LKLDIPTIVCGPGSINQAHKPDEYIAIEQMEKGGKFMNFPPFSICSMAIYSSGLCA
jgi:hypothetical protein